MLPLGVVICEHTAFLYLGLFYNKFDQTRFVQSIILLMYKNILHDLNLPSKFLQHSDLNGDLFVCRPNCNTILSLHSSKLKRQSVCASANTLKLSFKLVTVLWYLNIILSASLIALSITIK